MCGAAGAAGTERPAAARVAARTHQRLYTYRLATVGGQHAAQTLLELDLGLPAEHLARARDVRLPYLGIVHRQRLVDDLALRASDPEDGLRELEDGELVRVAEVDRQMLTALGEEDDASDQVVDVAEAARLRA